MSARSLENGGKNDIENLNFGVKRVHAQGVIYHLSKSHAPCLNAPKEVAWCLSLAQIRVKTLSVMRITPRPNMKPKSSWSKMLLRPTNPSRPKIKS